jgi:tetratricopeptide (TPR) repeat protein
VPGRISAKALYGAGELATFQGKFSRALPLLEQGLTLARESGDLALTVRVLHRLGVVAQSQGDLGRATSWYEESLALARQLGEPALIRFPLKDLAQVAYYQGDLQQADAHIAVVVEMDRQAGDLNFQAYDLGIWAAIRLRQGDLPQTFRLLREALTVLREAVERGWPVMIYVPYQLLSLAEALAVAGRSEQAARFLGAAEAQRATQGIPWRVLERADTEVTAAPVRAALGEEAWAVAYAAGQALTLEEAIAEALDATFE